MKAARLVKPYQMIFEEKPIPEIRENQVLLKILCFGICGSDLQIYHGQHKYAAMPIIMGHEIAAQIEKTGSRVTGISPGDKVTIEPQVTCGSCYPCQTGRFNVCEQLKVIGVHMDGCNQEYYAVDSKYLHKIPDAMENGIAALTEPMAVGVGAVKRSRKYKGGNVVIVGAGTIGNLTAQAAKGLGAEQVMITDLIQEKLDYARECNVDYAVNTSEISLKKAIEKCFGKRKADVIIDCAANPKVFQSILEAARPSSEIILTGNYKVPVTLEVPAIQRQEIELIGHMMYVREDFEDAIRLLEKGEIETGRTISHRFPFDKYPEALEFIDKHSGKIMKVIIDM